MQRVAKMEALVERLQGGQKRQDGSSNALHVKRVAAIVGAALGSTKEHPEQETTLRLAALGHDLLEDTPATKEELRESFGEEMLLYVQELTNAEGDSHTATYVAQMAAASEEARLIKYADLCDNLLHASYSAKLLGASWVHGYLLPIVDPMRAALDLTSFKKFPRTAELLRATAALARAHLGESVRDL